MLTPSPQASSRRRRKECHGGQIIAAAIAAASLVFGASFAAASSTGGSLKGAGSTFVFPLVSQWQANYKNAQITYGSVGSGAGIAAITGRTVDFGASDAPLTKDQASACRAVSRSRGRFRPRRSRTTYPEWRMA